MTDSLRKYRDIFSYTLLGVVAATLLASFIRLVDGVAVDATLSAGAALLVALAVAIAVHGNDDRSPSARVITIAALAVLGVAVVLGLWGLIKILSTDFIDQKASIAIGQLAALVLTGLVAFYATVVLRDLPAPVRAQQPQQPWGPRPQQGGWGPQGPQQGSQQGWQQPQGGQPWGHAGWQPGQPQGQQWSGYGAGAYGAAAAGAGAAGAGAAAAGAADGGAQQGGPQGSYGDQQGAYGDQPASYGEQQGAYGDQSTSYGEQQGAYGDQQGWSAPSTPSSPQAPEVEPTEQSTTVWTPPADSGTPATDRPAEAARGDAWAAPAQGWGQHGAAPAGDERPASGWGQEQGWGRDGGWPGQEQPNDHGWAQEATEQPTWQSTNEYGSGWSQNPAPSAPEQPEQPEQSWGASAWESREQTAWSAPRGDDADTPVSRLGDATFDAPVTETTYEAGSVEGVEEPAGDSGADADSGDEPGEDEQRPSSWWTPGSGT